MESKISITWTGGEPPQNLEKAWLTIMRYGLPVTILAVRTVNGGSWSEAADYRCESSYEPLSDAIIAWAPFCGVPAPFEPNLSYV